MDRTGGGVLQAGFGAGQFIGGQRAELDAVGLPHHLGDRDGRLERGGITVQQVVAIPLHGISRIRVADEDVVLAGGAQDDRRVSRCDPLIPVRRRVAPILQQGAEMMRQPAQVITDVIGAARCDPEQRGEIPRHCMGTNGLALDEPGIAIAGLATELAAIDQHDRPAAALQLQRRRHADHAAAEDDRASH